MSGSLATTSVAQAAGRAVAGVPVLIDAGGAGLRTAIDAWLRRAFALTDIADSARSALTLHVADGPRHAPFTSADGSLLVDTPRCRVRRDATRVHLSFPSAQSTLDLSAGTGRLWLADGWSTQPLKLQQDPWILSLAWLLRERDRYALHASAVVQGDRALLIAGASGSGKSSTALSLIYAGWSWLADDLVLYEPGAEPRLHGLARGFAFHTALAQRLPGLAGEPIDNKQFADIDRLFPDRRAECGHAVALLFPRVTDGPTSHLERLSSLDALGELLPACGGIMVGGATGRAQVAALRDLVATVPGYRLHAGRDIFGRGEVLEQLFAKHGVLNCAV
jgi:hypothetical protein